MKHLPKSHNPIDVLYLELKEEDKKYGGKRIKRTESDLHKKRPIKNLTKAWNEHVEDYDEVDDFYAD